MLQRWKDNDTKDFDFLIHMMMINNFEELALAKNDG